MGDIYVHVRMKECCRGTLKDLDKRKKKAKFKGGLLGTLSLFEAMAEKTIDDALGALPGGGHAGGVLEELTRAACVKVCEHHASQHEGKGETEEGAFWRHAVAAMTGKPAPARLAKAGALAGAGGSGVSKAWNGQAVADMAKAKGKEYKEKGVKYSMSPPYYPASAHSDCSHFVNETLKASGVNVPYVTTAGIAGSKSFTEVTSPQPGDVIWQPGKPGDHGHMGIYTGQDAAGHPLGEQMGTHGAAEGKWGDGGWFHGGGETKYYRPVVE
jgi:hypothetical protein